MISTACGYRFGRGELIERYRTICIPYVEGDRYGWLTASLIKTITTRGVVAYRSCGAELALHVCLHAPIDTNIGFAYATEEEDKHIVVSNEARLRLVATVTLIDRMTGQVILGPLDITSSIDYDFEPDLGNVSEHAFALGQLEMQNLAQDAAFQPLYTILSQKIVDYINNCW